MAGKSPVRNYAIEWVGRGGATLDEAATIAASLIAAAAEPSGDPLGEVVDGDSPFIEGLPTEETDTSKVLKPDGTGGLIWQVASTFLPWLYAKADGGCAIDGVTDDAATFTAFVDSATVGYTKSAWIRIEAGTMLIAGATQDTSAFNSQVLLPRVTTGPGITLTIEGPTRPYWHGYPYGDAGEAVIESTLTGASGTAAVFSGGNGITNRLSVVLRNLRCVAPANPTFTFWNLSSTFEGLREGVLITSDGSLTQPTHSNSYGIRHPGSSIGSQTLADVFVIGFFHGHQVGELSYGHLSAWYCAEGVELSAGGHLSNLHLEILNCPKGVTATGTVYVDAVMDNEHANTAIGQPAWTVNVADLYDPNNYVHGHFRWTGVLAGIGADHTFLVTGGTNSSNAEVGPLSAGAPTTADYLVGTASAGLSAEIVVGTTPGGELGGTWPSPTVDTTHSGSSHAAATTAAIAASEAYTDAAIAALAESGLLTVDAGVPTYDTSGADVVFSIATKWGYDGSGPYYDSAGAASGQEAILAVDPTVGDLIVVPYNP